MKLLRLSANQPTFKTVRFNPIGLSLVVGRRKQPEEKGGKRTFNGVGKSLVLYFVHFCLGSKEDKRLGDLRPSWDFTLTFLIDGKEHTATRATQKQTEIVHNGVPLDLEKFTDLLGELVFDLTRAMRPLTFRSLIKRFIRSGKAAYLRYNQFEEKEEDYQQLLANGYLFGLDLELIRRKHDLREAEKQARDLLKRLEDDDVFRGFFKAQSDASIERKDLEEQLRRVEGQLGTFQVAEDYAETKSEAASLRRRLKEIADDMSAMQGRIEAINAALKLGGDISRDDLVGIYEGAKVVLKEGVKRQLADLERFHIELLRDREHRFRDERSVLERRIGAHRQEESARNRRLNELMRYLDSHGEMQEYLALTKKFNSVSAELEKVKGYQAILGQYRDKIQGIKLEQEQQTVQATDFLKKFEPTLVRNMDLFRDLSSRFYENRAGGVSVQNNEKPGNQIRFHIHCQLDDDSASGINEVKMFCYDAMVLRARHRHKVDFLFHDSLLFSNMDPRQRTILFREARSAAEAGGQQYLATVNEDTLESIRQVTGDDEYKKIFDGATVLQLTDESDAAKLLGVKIALDYDP